MTDTTTPEVQLHVGRGWLGKPWTPDLACCRAGVHEQHGVGFHQCGNRAKYFVEVLDRGEVKTAGFCAAHEPSRVAARDAKRAEAYRAKWAARDAESAKRRKAEELRARALEALRQIADGHNDPRALALEVLGDGEPGGTEA